MKQLPQVYIIAGPNGAGKTTFANTLLPKYVKCVNFVNADLIAQGLSPLNPARVALKAGRILREEINDLARKKADFAFESTLAGRTHIQIIDSLKKVVTRSICSTCGFPRLNYPFNALRTGLRTAGIMWLFRISAGVSVRVGIIS